MRNSARDTAKFATAFMVAMGTLSFLSFDVVAHGFVSRLDESLLEAIHAHTSGAWLTLFRVVSWLGAPESIAVFAVLVGVWLSVEKRHTELIVWAATLVSGALIEKLLKMAIARPRPDYAALFNTFTYCFPSAHVVGATLAFAMLPYVIQDDGITIAGKRLRPSLVRWLGFVVILAVGFSRVYLGVHYPGDVIAGYALGTAFVSAGAFTLRRLQHQPASKQVSAGQR